MKIDGKLAQLNLNRERQAPFRFAKCFDYISEGFRSFMGLRQGKRVIRRARDENVF